MKDFVGEYKMKELSKKRKKEIAILAAGKLEELYPDAECALKWGGGVENGWKLMVMGRLSAQCTDARVNIVCEELFSRFSTVESLAAASVDEIEEIIRPCGLFHTKAADIKGECEMLVSAYGGIVPDNMDKLLEFRGVGRKIANLLLGDLYNMGGIVADTHCIRICGRLGFYPESLKDPVKVERIMSEFIPGEKQSDFCHRIVQFGRDTCSARSPKCENCSMKDFCAHNMKK